MDQKRHILIVDDDVDLADLLAQAVNDESDVYDVKVARDVDGAMVQVQKAQTAQRPFDLVITDIKMLGLSGLELLEALASIAPATKTITMTAYTSPELAERAHELNVFAYLTKPFVLSEFRQIVRSALFPAAEAQPEPKPSAELSVAQQVAIVEELATLRAMAGTTIAFLMRADGTVIAADSPAGDTDIAGLCGALLEAQAAVTAQMARAFGQDCLVRQNYFGTETNNVCTYRLDANYVVAVVFGPAVKEGQVWYYVREAAKKLQRLLVPEPEPALPESTTPGDDLFDILDQYFPQRRRARAMSSEAPVVELAAASEPAPAQDQVPVEPSEPSTQVEDSPTAEPALLREIDWNMSSPLTWDQIVATTDQGFSGLTLEQAQQQGLVGANLVQGEQSTPNTEPSPKALPVDKIDWDAPVNLDWDEIATHTDQGFAGLSLEEARKQGLIGEI